MRLVTLLLSLLASSAIAQSAFVQGTSTSATCSNSCNLAFGSNVTAGACLFAMLRNTFGSTPSSVSDGVNGAWTSSFANASPTQTSHGWHGYRFMGAGAGATTVTVSYGASTDLILLIIEYYPCKTTLVDSDTSELDNVDPATCAANTATAANQRQVGFIGHSSTATIAPNSSETQRVYQTARMQAQDKLTSGAGAITQSWDFDFAVDAVCWSIILDSGASIPIIMHHRGQQE